MNPVEHDDLRRLSDAPTVVGPTQSFTVDGAEALTVAYRDHSRAVYSFAMRLCGPCAAEDVTQEVFLSLWRNPERFDPARGTMRSLLLAMTHHRAVDLTRSSASRRHREDRSAWLADAAPADVEEQIENNETIKHIHAALDTLPLREKEAIVTAYFGGWTYREAAVVLSESEGTIKSRIRSGRRRLRSVLDEDSNRGARAKPLVRLNGGEPLTYISETGSTRASQDREPSREGARH